MSAPLRARVEITLKQGIRDPQGLAIESALTGLGFDGVANVRVGKHITFDVSGPHAEAVRKVVEMCEKLLANPVIEEYAYEVAAKEPVQGGAP